MCDTSVVVGSATFDGSVIFAKNSDRKANECQPLCFYPGERHAPGSALRCTHREIPQVCETYAVIGSRPYWMWGFEIGVNEHGVAIGNEAVYGREGFADDGLLGMDYLRLGLERGKTAHEALRVMVELLERYGQGGNCDVIEPRTYHNSFILADPREAWVLETAGRYWVAERVKGRRAISNCYTITTAWDEASPDLVDHAIAEGWWTRGADFNFARAYGDPTRDVRSGQCRFQRATRVLGERRGLAVAELLAVLRDHGSSVVEPDGSETPMPICMHEAPPRVGATAASTVVHLRPDQPAPLSAVAWHSFGSPCLAGVVPLYPAAGPTPPELAVGAAELDAASPWWLNERIQRRADAFPGLQRLVRETWQRFESDSFGAATKAETRASGVTADSAEHLLRQASEARTAALIETLQALDARTERLAEAEPLPSAADRRHWDALNAPVGLEVIPVSRKLLSKPR